LVRGKFDRLRQFRAIADCNCAPASMTSNKASNLAILVTYENGRPTGSGDT
jgi:hypothetical protein